MNELYDGEAQVTYGLAKITTDHNHAHDISMTDTLSKHDYDEMVVRLEQIARVAVRDMYDFVVRNYEHLVAQKSHYVQVYNLLQENVRPDPKNITVGFMSAVLNFLNSMRIFVDHEETALSRLHGKESPQLREFKRILSETYDSTVSYRFLYQLRNYATHCGVPVGHVSLSFPESNSEVQLDCLLDRDHLLNVFNWKQVRRDLQSMDPMIDIMPHIHEGMKSIYEIMKTVACMDIKEARTAAAELRRNPCFPGVNDEATHLIRFETLENGRKQITPTPIQFNAIELLEDERIADIDLLVCGMPSIDRPARPELSSHAMGLKKRGLAALTSWTQDGDQISGFNSTVQQIIHRDDGNVEPIISGSILVSYLLLRMTALTLNTTDEHILRLLYNDNE